MIDHAQFYPAELDAVIEGGPLDAPLADAKLHKITRGDFTPEFPLEWALKDVDLAVEAGYGRDDVSAVRLALGNPGPCLGLMRWNRWSDRRDARTKYGSP